MTEKAFHYLAAVEPKAFQWELQQKELMLSKDTKHGVVGLSLVECLSVDDKGGTVRRRARQFGVAALEASTQRWACCTIASLRDRLACDTATAATDDFIIRTKTITITKDVTLQKAAREEPIEDECVHREHLTYHRNRLQGRDD